MKKLLTVLGYILVTLAVAAAVVPLIIPIPPLKDTRSIAELADPDSRFIDVNGLTVHYKIYGEGEPYIVLLHGFGASLFSWQQVLQPLSQYGTVIAYDRPGFGLTERPMPEEWDGENPYTRDAQEQLLLGLLDALEIEQAILVGNSAGGTVSVATALNHPERIKALVLVDAAIFTTGGGPSYLRWLFRLPQVDRLGPWLVRNIQKWGMELIKTAWHDPSKITPAVLEGYIKPLQVENWDRALWEMNKVTGEADLAERLGELRLPVQVVTGDDDRIVPTADSVRLAEEIPGAELIVFERCGHVPQEECPQQFLEAAGEFLEGIK